jgi:queuosine precursor transporter
VTATQPTAARPFREPRASSTYAGIVAVFCGLLLISNIAATKPITVVEDLPWVGDIYADGGALLFPLTYVLGDVLAEIYGFRRALHAVWVGFGLAALAVVTFFLVGVAPAAPGYENQEAFTAVLGFVWRIVLASFTGYLVGQFLNAYVLVWLKRRSGGPLWRRLVGSTVVGEFADTVLFAVIAFGGLFTVGQLVSFTVTGYLYKVVVELACLPVTVRVIAAIRRRESIAR